ncbi:Uncharacterised protein [BD1-7 clade bacterium]|uniref:Chemotaxis protein n=1 Tax=BD1-7 clade bacterium TaxID=2029982 RepID=A0A5S9P7H0_9GAMM|nr:Uncharacterised protein [BD1-7 clade bacterium]
MDMTRSSQFIALVSKTLATLILTCVMSSCSLFDVQIENPSVPLTDNQMTMRTVTRGFLPTYFEGIESVSDNIIDSAPEKSQRVATLYWKIYTENTAVSAALRTDPEAALVDFALLTAQQKHLFQTPVAEKHFGAYTADIAVAMTHLNGEFEDIAKAVMNPDTYQKMQGFIQAQIANQDGHNFFEKRGDVIRAWYAWNGVALDKISGNPGSLPQTMADLTDQINWGSQQAGKTLEWKLQALSEKSSLDDSKIAHLLESLERTSEQVARLTDLTPDDVSKLSEAMVVQLQPLVDGLEQQIVLFQGAIGQERQALTAAINDQRIALGYMVDEQRNLAVADLKTLAEELVAQVIPQMRSMIVIVLIALLVFILVLFAVPFYLGFLIGRYRTQAANSAVSKNG